MSYSSFYDTLTFTLVRPRSTKDNSGASKRVWSPVPGSESVPGSLQPVSAQDRQSLGQRLIHVSHKIYFDEDPGFARGDRVESSDGRTFLVYASFDVASLSTLWTVYCREKP